MISNCDQEEFEDTNRIVRIRKSKDRQHNGQKTKDKRINNDLQNTTQKSKDREIRNPELNSCAPEG